MSSDDEEVGYKKPPRSSQWQKGGPSPNPAGRPKKKSSTVAEFIERALLEEIKVPTVDGKQKRVTYFEIILMQLMKKVAENSSRQAYRTLRKYQRFADTKKMKRGVEIRSRADAARAYERFLKGEI